MVIGSKGYPDLKIALPCAPGAQIVDSVPVEQQGSICMDLTYIARSDAKAVTERLCPGERARIGGTAVGEEIG